jgi:hypothetical protein
MLPVSAAFKSAVATSHNAVTKVEAYFGGGPGALGTLIHPGLPIVDGSVTVDASSQVRRSLSLTVAAPELFPGQFDYTGPLAPYGTMLKAYRGVQYPTGAIEWCPLGVFRIDGPSVAMEPGTVTVSASDLSTGVRDARFLAPTTSITSNAIRAEIARLVRGAYGAAFPVRDLTGKTTLTPALTWDTDRWGAIVQLASSLGAEVVFDGNGQCIIQPQAQVTDAVDWPVTSSQVVVRGTRALSREETYNIVVASGERTDNTPPVRAVAQDTDPSSPTYVSGPFGPVPVFYSSPVLATTAQAATAAATILGRVRTMARRVAFECVPNPAVDVGDMIQITYPDGSWEKHIVDSLQIPLQPTDTMRVTTRTSTVAGLS